MSIVQGVLAQTIRSRQAVALLTLVTVVVTLPLNSGSYDFTFSIDIYTLAFCVFLAFRSTRVRIPTADSSAAGK
jgi:hypothetical protein